jgi:hypothetical protein
MFIGYIEENQDLYLSLQKAGYILVFKEVLKIIFVGDNFSNFFHNTNVTYKLQFSKLILFLFRRKILKIRLPITENMR